MNGPSSGPPAPDESTSAVFKAALGSVRRGMSTSELAQVLQQTLSDEGNDKQVLNRSQRRALMASTAERVGAEAASRALVESLSSIRTQKGLSGLLADCGPHAIQGVETMRAILARFGITDSSPPDEASIAQIFASLLAIHSEELGDASATNWSVLAQALSSYRQGQTISWSRAIRSIDDFDGLVLPAYARLEGFASAIAAASFDNSSSPAVAGLWGPWTHKVLQLSILSGLLALDGETFSFANLPGRKIVKMADLVGASATVRQSASASERSTWNSLDLVETLALLAADGQADTRQAVTSLLERFIKEAPELLLMGLVQIPEPWNAIHIELAQKLLGMFFASAPGHQLVFYVTYQTNRPFIMQALVRSYLNNPSNITRVVDIAQDLKALPSLLEVRADPAKPFYFALDVAALAARREVLNGDLYVDRMIHEHGTAFVRATLDFLGEKLRDELALQEQDPAQQQQQQQQLVPPSVQTVATFLRRLRAHGDTMSAEDIEAFKMARNLALQLHPRLLPIRASESQEPGMEVATFGQDVHDECDETFGRMYKQELSVEDVVAVLQRLKASSRQEETELFACMVHTLFDEQRWIRSYPPTELRLTAHLFGDLIQHSLIDYVPLGIAIRGCLDALRTQPGGPMFDFGLEALKRFQGRLQDWPQLAQALQALPPHPEISSILTRAAEAPPLAADGSIAKADEVQPIFTAIDPGQEPRRGGEQQIEPSEEASDRVLFAINNLSPSNLDAKLADVRPALTSNIFRWFAHYLTIERVQFEPNFHALYLRFLEAVSDAHLDAFVLRETLMLAHHLINSDSTVSTLQSRKALQNVGSWLGLLTLARDKPIRFKHLDFKMLLLQGYDSGRLIVAVPFVAKVLEQCNKSKIFKLPNPWLNAVLRLLAELYQLPELKLNLRFEIEVLCKSLGLDLKDIQPSSIIRSRELLPPAPAQPSQAALQQQQQQQAIAGVPTGEMERLGLGGAAARSVQEQQRRGNQMPLQQQLMHSGQGLPGQQQPQQQQQQHQHQQHVGVASAASANAYAESLAQMLQNLPHYVQISPQLTLFQNAALKRLIYVAIDRAIREIIAPVVERSVTIASISTRELVTKDFAMEGDEEKMRESAHQMAANLAGSLALVTCKEPLRVSMISHARTLFLQSGFTDQTLPEPAIVGIMQDNLELACSVVEKAAMDKAMPEVDDGLAPAYNQRRDHRQHSRGYFYDQEALRVSQYGSNLPEGLRLKVEGLQPQQLRVYQDFGNFTRSPPQGGAHSNFDEERAQATMAASSGNGLGGATAGQPPMGSMVGSERDGFSGAMPDGVAVTSTVLSAQESLDRFGQCISEIERLLAKQTGEETIADLPQGHELRDIVRQVIVIASQSNNCDEAALAFSQKVVQLLFKSESALARDTYVILLERLCELSLKVAKEVTAWLVYAEDERKFNVPVTVSLIRAGLINIAETDLQTTRLIMRDFKPSVVDFAAKLALECLQEPPCATRGQLGNMIEALGRAAKQSKATDAALQFLEELEGGQLRSDKTDVSNSALREQLAFCFAEWVRLFQHSPNVERSFVDFVTQLQSQGILKGEEISSMFFRVCTEVGVDSYIKQKASGGSFATGIFSPVDAFSKMVVLMIKYHADPAGAKHDQAKVHYLTKILSIVVLVLAQSHEELGPHFQQKPFFRLFSSLLHDLHLAEGSLGTAYLQTLLAVGNTLNTLQPTFFPSFTFSWMSLVSHRLFMPKLLANRQHGWPAFQRLFCSLLRFLAPILRKAELQETSRSLYRGTLRIFLVLLHDFPDFLAAYHHSLCDLIPDTCIQMRNLVLSAFPRDRRLPDPFAASLKVDRMPEIGQPPLIISDYQSTLTALGGDMRSALMQYLADSTPSNLPEMLAPCLVLSKQNRAHVQGEEGEDEETSVLSFDSRYNVPLVNAVVLTAGVASIEKPSNLLNGSADSDVGFDLIRGLFKALDPEGRYLVLSACANQLRYPSSHSAYYSFFLLALFGHPETTEQDKAQVLRVLLERIIVYRPHPWALLCTVFELLRGNAAGRYTMPPGIPVEIERLLDHIRSGLGPSGGAGNLMAQSGASPAARNAQAQAPQA